MFFLQEAEANIFISFYKKALSSDAFVRSESDVSEKNCQEDLRWRIELSLALTSGERGRTTATPVQVGRQTKRQIHF